MNKLQSRIFDALVVAGEALASSNRAVGGDRVREDILDSLVDAAAFSVVCPVCEANSFNHCAVIDKKTGEVKRYLSKRPHVARVQMLKEFGIDLYLWETE